MPAPAPRLRSTAGELSFSSDRLYALSRPMEDRKGRPLPSCSTLTCISAARFARKSLRSCTSIRTSSACSQPTEEISAAWNFLPKIPRPCSDIAAPKWNQPENTSLRSRIPKPTSRPIEIRKLTAVFKKPAALATRTEKKKSERRTAFTLIEGHAELLTHLFFHDSDRVFHTRLSWQVPRD